MKDGLDESRSRSFELSLSMIYNLTTPRCIQRRTHYIFLILERRSPNALAF